MLKKSRRHRHTEGNTENGDKEGAVIKTGEDEQVTVKGTNNNNREEEEGVSQLRKHRHHRKEIDPIKASRRKSRLCIGETLNRGDDDDDDDDEEEEEEEYENTNENSIEKAKKHHNKCKTKGSLSDGGDDNRQGGSSSSNSNSNNNTIVDSCDIEVEVPKSKAHSSGITTTTTPTVGYQKPHLAKPLPPSKATGKKPSQQQQQQPPSQLSTTTTTDKKNKSNSNSNSKKEDDDDDEEVSEEFNSNNNNNNGRGSETRKTRSSTLLRANSGRGLGGGDDLSFVAGYGSNGANNVFTAVGEGYSPRHQGLLTPRTFYVNQQQQQQQQQSGGNNNNNNNNSNGCAGGMTGNGKVYNEECSECCWRKYMDYKAISYIQKMEEFYSARSIAIIETEGLSTPLTTKKKSQQQTQTQRKSVPQLSFDGSNNDDNDDNNNNNNNNSNSSSDECECSNTNGRYDCDDNGALVDGFRDAELASNFEDPFNFIRLEDVLEPDDIWEELRSSPPLLTKIPLSIDDPTSTVPNSITSTSASASASIGANPNNNTSSMGLRERRRAEAKGLRDAFLLGDPSVLNRPRYSVQQGSLNRLIQCLTPEDGRADPTYIAAFMMTYPRFTTTQTVVNKLIARYLAPKQEAPPRRVMVRTGVLTAVAALLLADPPDLSPADARRLALLVRRAWADGYEAECTAVADASRAQQLDAATLGASVGVSISAGQQQTFAGVQGGCLLECPVRAANFSSETVVRLAEQMCLIDGGLYGKIEPREFLVNWEAPKNMGAAQGIRAATRRFNAVSVWATSLVIQTADARAQAVEVLVRLADTLRSLGNYQALNAVVAGLTRGCIAPHVNSALKKGTAADVRGKFQELRELMSGTNWVREAAGRAPPVIPFLGKYQTDIFHITDTMPDKTQDGQIFFRKHMLLYQAIKEALRGKCAQYSFARIPELHFYALSLPERLSEEQLDNYVAKK